MLVTDEREGSLDLWNAFYLGEVGSVCFSLSLELAEARWSHELAYNKENHNCYKQHGSYRPSREEMPSQLCINAQLRHLANPRFSAATGRVGLVAQGRRFSANTNSARTRQTVLNANHLFGAFIHRLELPHAGVQSTPPSTDGPIFDRPSPKTNKTSLPIGPDVKRRMRVRSG